MAAVSKKEKENMAAVTKKEKENFAAITKRKREHGGCQSLFVFFFWSLSFFFTDNRH